jgi:hypothetical protein
MKGENETSLTLKVNKYELWITIFNQLYVQIFKVLSINLIFNLDDIRVVVKYRSTFKG